VQPAPVKLSDLIDRLQLELSNITTRQNVVTPRVCLWKGIVRAQARKHTTVVCWPSIHCLLCKQSELKPPHALQTSCKSTARRGSLHCRNSSSSQTRQFMLTETGGRLPVARLKLNSAADLLRDDSRRRRAGRCCSNARDAEGFPSTIVCGYCHCQHSSSVSLLIALPTFTVLNYTCLRELETRIQRGSERFWIVRRQPTCRQPP